MPSRTRRKPGWRCPAGAEYRAAGLDLPILYPPIGVEGALILLALYALGSRQRASQAPSRSLTAPTTAAAAQAVPAAAAVAQAAAGPFAGLAAAAVAAQADGGPVAGLAVATTTAAVATQADGGPFAGLGGASVPAPQAPVGAPPVADSAASCGIECRPAPVGGCGADEFAVVNRSGVGYSYPPSAGMNHLGDVCYGSAGAAAAAAFSGADPLGTCHTDPGGCVGAHGGPCGAYEEGCVPYAAADPLWRCAGLECAEDPNSVMGGGVRMPDGFGGDPCPVAPCDGAGDGFGDVRMPAGDGGASADCTVAPCNAYVGYEEGADVRMPGEVDYGGGYAQDDHVDYGGGGGSGGYDVRMPGDAGGGYGECDPVLGCP